MPLEKVSGLDPLTTNPALTDKIPLVDVSDTTQAASGTTKYIEVSPFSAQLVQTMPGRLSASSTLAEPTSDLTGVTSLYYPLTYRNGIYGALYDGTAMRLYDMSSVSALSLSGLGHDTVHDVFMYANSGVATMEFSAWTQPSGNVTDATNATPIVITSAAHGLANGDIVAVRNVGGNTATNGVWIVANKTADTFELETSVGSGAYTTGGTWRKMNLTEPTRATQSGLIVKNGDATRRLLGTILVDAAGGAVSFGLSQRGIWNLYNKKLYRLRAYNSTASWVNSSGATWRELNSGTGMVRGYFVLGRTTIPDKYGFGITTVSASTKIYFAILHNTNVDASAKRAYVWSISNQMQEITIPYISNQSWTGLPAGFNMLTIAESVQSGTPTVSGNFNIWIELEI